MSLAVQSVPILTNGSGVDASTIRAGGAVIRRIVIEVGTLSTPDIAITDEPSGVSILAVAGLTDDASYVPLQVGQDDAGADISGSAVPVPVIERIQIATSGGGATKAGRVLFLLER